MEKSYTRQILREEGMRVGATLYGSPDLPVEEGALRQLKDACRVPSVRQVLATPDIHVGFGVPIGCVMATEEVVVPAAVGYDINCGMRVLTTDRFAEDTDAATFAHSIRRDIPLGEGKSNVAFGRDDFLAVMEGGLAALAEQRHHGHRVWEFYDPESERRNLERVEDRGSMEGVAEAVPEAAIERGHDQLGTLGGGNHFIELQEVEQVLDARLAERLGVFAGQFALMIHSGSRGFGHEIGGHFMKIAKAHNERHGGNQSPYLHFLPLDGRAAQDYIGAMRAAANFAYANRALMGALALGNFHRLYPDARAFLVYDVCHNMAKPERHQGRELWVHRKGATRAFDRARMAGTPFADVGQPVLIPGSMGTGSYLLVGQPTGEASLFSVNHGAGRVLSRTAASGHGRHGKRKEAAISDAEFDRSMEGVYLVAENRRQVKEEAPAAYKDIDAVIATVAEAELARPVARMIPRAVLKG